MKISLRGFLLVHGAIAVLLGLAACKLVREDRQFRFEETVTAKLAEKGVGVQRGPSRSQFINLCRPSACQRIHGVYMLNMHSTGLQQEDFLALLRGCKELQFVAGSDSSFISSHDVHDWRVSISEIVKVQRPDVIVALSYH